MALPFIPADIRVKSFKMRSTLDKMTNYEVQKHTGLSLEHVKQLFEILQPFLENPTRRGNAVPAETQLIAAISFFRSGSFQYVEGTVGGISQPTVSRILQKLSTSIVQNLVKDYVKFPTEVLVLNKIKQDFFDIARFPNIGGVIDGTHIAIKAPSEQENSYVNRKGFHSINVQVVCAPNNSILDAVVKWPGCTNDSYIWNNCGLKSKFDAGVFGETWLLGDSGYGTQHYLLTPFLNPASREEFRFNNSLKVTRSIIERTIGIWKSRFRSMDKSGGLLCYTPDRCCNLILSTIFLHNFYLFLGVPLSVEGEQYVANFRLDDMTAPQGLVEDASGVLTRNNVVHNYFTLN